MAALATPVADPLNLTWTLGSNWLLVVELRGAKGDQLLPGQVTDVQARIADASHVLLDLDASASNGISFPDAAGAYALISIPPAEQAAFAVGAYRYEVRVLDLQGNAFSLQYGVITVAPSLFNEFPPVAGSGGGGGFDFSDPDNAGVIPQA